MIASGLPPKPSTPHAPVAAPESPAASRGASVDIHGLTHRYGDRIAVDNVTFAVGAGEMFALLGPNGGGKTTLFRILSTLMRPVGGGTALICGQDVVRAPAAVRNCIGVTFQSPSLDGKLTVEENLRVHGRLYGLSGAELRARIEELTKTFDIADRRKDRADALSGGLRRRVEIAKSIMHRPRVLLLDEPSTGLDPSARRDLQSVLRALSAEGMTVFLTTHLMEEAENCSRVAIIDSRLVAIGEPEELRSSIGGDVITFDADDHEDLVRFLCAHMPNVAPVLGSDCQIRVEHSAGHKFVVSVIDAYPGRIRAVHVGKPTLGDVFMHHTGRRLDRERAIPEVRR